jgi:stress response protein YsnF
MGPIMVEEPGIKKPQVETGRAGISKTVHERQGIVDEPLCREEVSIERVPIRRFVDRAMPVRYAGDTMTVPHSRKCWWSRSGSC